MKSHYHVLDRLRGTAAFSVFLLGLPVRAWLSRTVLERQAGQGRLGVEPML